MPSFSRVINAAAILVVLGGLVGYFGTQGNREYYSFVPDSPASDRFILSSDKTRTINAPDTHLYRQDGLHSITPEIFDALIAESYHRPVFFMIYASWCPHCKRMFTALNSLAANYHDTLKIVTLSIDNKPEKAKAFIQHFLPLRLTTMIVTDQTSYRIIGDKLRAAGLHFKGGKDASQPVPYNVMFYQGKAVAEIEGALPDDKLKQLLDDAIAYHAKQSQR